MALVTKENLEKSTPVFTPNEIDFLLRHVATSRFDGKDVLLLGGIVQKLQTMQNET